MTVEMRMLLKVSVHAINSPVGTWNASFMDKGHCLNKNQALGLFNH